MSKLRLRGDVEAREQNSNGDSCEKGREQAEEKRGRERASERRNELKKACSRYASRATLRLISNAARPLNVWTRPRSRARRGERGLLPGARRSKGAREACVLVAPWRSPADAEKKKKKREPKIATSRRFGRLRVACPRPSGLSFALVLDSGACESSSIGPRRRERGERGRERPEARRE